MSRKSIITKIDGVPIVKEEPDSEPIEAEVINLPLTDEEREGHQKRIKLIQQGLQHIAVASLEIWQALQWIHDHKTYREKHNTFNDFCKDELGKDNSQIYRHLKDAKFKEQLLLAAENDAERSSIMHLKESNTRFIRTLPPDVQEAFWKVAYGIGVHVLPKKEDGSIEATTQFLTSVGEKVDEITEQGGLHLDGNFIPVTAIQRAAEVSGVEEDKLKTALLHVGIAEEYYEAIKRQEQHIKDKSMRADFIPLKGTIENRVDMNGSDYPVLTDSKGNEHDLTELLLSFNNRFVILSIKSPIAE